MRVMRIVNWSQSFETAENKKLLRLTWLALPTKQEGDGYTELMSAHENGCAHFGAWTAMLQLAAKCTPRGTLVRNLGGRSVAHDAASVGRITRVPVSVLEEAIPRLVEIGWLEAIEYEEVAESARKPAAEDGKPAAKDGQPVATGQGRTGEDSTAQHSGGEETPPPSASPVQGGGPLTPEARMAKLRVDYLVILRANAVKLELGKQKLFEEWCAEADKFRLGWVEHLLKIHRPKIRLPSDLRKALKANAEQYRAWLEKNK